MISDLHLSDERPEITTLFLQFLKQRAFKSEGLYILGDLFEAWIGDDAVAVADRPVITALKNLTDAGCPLFLICGNRDFLLGEVFEEETGATLLADPTVIDLFGVPTLLMHGDTLCTDDVEYQTFRRQIRSDEWQQEFLAKSVDERRQIANYYRRESKQCTKAKPETITDVNDRAVLDILGQYGVRQLIHGHTHRPATHRLKVGGQPAQRIVLGDWYEQGSVLRCDEAGCVLEELPI